MAKPKVAASKPDALLSHTSRAEWLDGISGIRQAAKSLLLLLTALSLSVAVLFGVSLMLIYDDNIYLRAYSTPDFFMAMTIEPIDGFPHEQLMGLLNYFRSSDQSMPSILSYTEQENSHIRDVKILLDEIRGMFYDCLVVCAASFFAVLVYSKSDRKKFLAKGLLYSGLIGLSILVFVGILSINFQSAFVGFHELFFPQGNWQFGSGSVMLAMFPQELFRYFLVSIAGISGSVYLILIGSGILLLYPKPKVKKKLD